MSSQDWNPTPSSSSLRSSSPPPSSTVTQLKYALFSWPNNPLTKRDPIAQEHFKANVQMSNFVTNSLGGFPLTLYEGSLGPDKPVELFLSEEQCQKMIDGLSEKMGPSRAKNSWKKDAIYPFRPGAFRRIEFQDQKSVEDRFSYLKDPNDRYETRNHAKHLLKTQEIINLVQAEAEEARFCAIDIETWEVNHELVTEVGFAKSVWRNGQFEPMEIKHFIVKENARHRNGRYCPDARDHFHFGRSETRSTSALVSFLKSELLSPTVPLFLLFHDHRSDVKSLELLGLSLSSFSLSSPLPSPSQEPKYLDQKGKGRWILDTQALFSGFNRRKKQSKLGDAVQQLGISLSDKSGELEGVGGYSVEGKGVEEMEKDQLRFHNSGNDAWATLLVFWKLMVAELSKEEE